MSILRGLIPIVRRSAEKNRMKGSTLNSDIKTNFVMNRFTWIFKKRVWGWDTNITAMGMEILVKTALEKMAYCFCK